MTLLSPRPPIESAAPMRLDLAGGWTDVPPFSAEVGGAVLNVAITRYVHVSARAIPDARVRLSSDDYHDVIEGLPDSALTYDGRLDLLKAAVHVTDLPHGVDLRVSSNVPPGAGLGASASVGVALLGALNRLRSQPWDRQHLGELAHRLEVDEIGVPGGRQDQYAALNGGFQYLEFNDPDVRSAVLDLSPFVLGELAERLVVCYTGKSRVSGNIIATVMGNYRRAEPRTTAALHRLKEIAGEMRAALEAHDLSAFGRLLTENWRCQKDLDPSVTNPQIDSLFDLAARHGATGGKALGAGGGGCLVFYAPDRPGRLRQALASANVTLLDFDLDFEGLQVWG